MNKKLAVQFGMTAGAVVIGALVAHAAPLGGGTASDIESFFSNSTTWIIRVIGGGVLTFGIIKATIKMIGDGDSHTGWDRIIAVLSAGVVLVFAPTIVNVLRGFAGQ